MSQPEDQHPDDLLRDARLATQSAEAAWSRYDDDEAGRRALKALRAYMTLDALVSKKKVELPREWQP